MVSLIGSRLRSAREQRGLSLQDAVHETRIPLQRLEWLEHDNYAAFGSLTYARAFLKIYSAFLQVDAAEMLDELPSSRLGGPRDYRYLTENFGPWVIADRRLDRQITALRQKKSERSPVPAGIALFVLLLAGTAIWGNHVAQQRNAAPPDSFPATQVEMTRRAIPAKKEIISAQTGPQLLPLPPELQGGAPVIHRLPRAFDTGNTDRVQ